MQRAMNVEKWFQLKEASLARFEKTEPRRIRIDVLAPQRTAVWYIDGNGETIPVGVVDGRDVLEFRAYGAFELMADADVWFYTIDGENLAFDIPGAVKLTKIMERRQRNPELERMIYAQNRNIERRMADMREEIERVWSRRLEAERAAAIEPALASASGGSHAEPKPPKLPASDSGHSEADAGSGDAAPAGASAQ